MKVCILGYGLSSLALAKCLINQGISVDVLSNQKTKIYDKLRTLGITKSNVDFFNKNICKINEALWDINKIEIFTDNLKEEKLIDFNNSNERLFSIIRNKELEKLLINDLKKRKFFKILKKTNLKNYNLIINCDSNNFLTKKYFYKKIKKNYKSYAHVTTFIHKKIFNNHTATQIFSNDGPIAFLPVSNTETSIVCSLRGIKKESKNYFQNIIDKYNTRYSINKINKVLSVELDFVHLRKYHHGNVLAFGDLLHKIHPHAGQGFNMVIRDIKELLDLIVKKKQLGLELDSSICQEFEAKTKHKNYLFSNGIDFIYEFFKFESKINNKFLSKGLQLLVKNKSINKFFTRFADDGIVL